MRFAAASAIVLVALVCAASARAQEPLVCGTPLFRTLPPGGFHTYSLVVPAGAEGVIQTSAVSMALGPRRMVLTGPDGVPIANTPTGIIQFSGRAGTLTLRVSQINGNTGGDYDVSLNIVSAGRANCGLPITCRASPDGVGFKFPGEVDSFQFDLVAAMRTVVKANYLERDSSPDAPKLRLWIFDPSAHPLTAQGTCTSNVPIQFDPAVTGTYTALVFACGVPVQQDYRIEVTQPGPVCPIGPTITHFGFTDSETTPLNPIGFDAMDRPIFNQPMAGGGGSLVIEARAGRSGRNPGLSTVPNGDQPPDVQVILSRALGDGDPTVCDIAEPHFGGVPATTPLAFEPMTQVTRDHIHDMGCRFNDGTGQFAGRTAGEACTRTSDGDFDFVDRGSNLQYCAQTAAAWAFALGDTVVAARAKDGDGNYGEPREIVVRIGPANLVTNTPTPTATPRPPTRTSTATRTHTHTVSPTSTRPFTLVPTRTETRTRTFTRTRTITPTPGTPTATATGPTPTITATATPNDCPGDCDGSRAVAIDELTRMVNIALGRTALSECYAGDADGDGAMNVNDLVSAVGSALSGCTAPAG